MSRSPLLTSHDKLWWSSGKHVRGVRAGSKALAQRPQRRRGTQRSSDSTTGEARLDRAVGRAALGTQALFGMWDACDP